VIYNNIIFTYKETETETEIEAEIEAEAEAEAKNPLSYSPPHSAPWGVE
jgi:hypothetical protein